MIDCEVAQGVRSSARHDNVHREQNQDDNDRARGYSHAEADPPCLWAEERALNRFVSRRKLVICIPESCPGTNSFERLPRYP